MKTSAATIEDEGSEAERIVSEIDPKHVEYNLDGQKWRQIFVQLPKGMILADLGEPSIWRKVQNNPRCSLRRLDQVRCFEWDEKWFADATVCFADALKAVLTAPKKTDMNADRYNKLPSDDSYETRWNGGVFEGIRRRDGATVFREATLQGAERALREQYPRRSF